MFNFKVRLGKVEYVLYLPEKITFIRGLSGLGKSLLIVILDILNQDSVKFELLDNSDYIAIEDITVLPTSSYDLIVDGLLANNSSKLIFIDEYNPILSDTAYFDKLVKSNNFLVVVSRDKVRVSFQYSISSIKKFVKYKSGIVIRNVLEDFYESECHYDSFKPDGIITEDEGNLSNILSDMLDLKVIPSKGAYKVGSKIRKTCTSNGLSSL